MANDEPMARKFSKTVSPKSMDQYGTTKISKKTVKQKQTSTKRGYGKKNKRKNKSKVINLSLLGTNAAGIKPKMESFYHTINKFRPSICTVQETKMNNKLRLKLCQAQV